MLNLQLLEIKLKINLIKMKRLILLIFVLTLNTTWSQKNDEAIMYINGKAVSSAEFENLYTKNLDMVQDPTQKDIDNYLNLFISYKLQLEDAYQKKYDTLPHLVKELKKYRDDLAKKYKTDEELIEKLIKEAYDRKKYEVNVSHILIQVAQNALPADTLKAYQKIMKIYKKAISGEDFYELAYQYSQDPSAKENRGKIGYITVFSTVYPFETAAYNTPVGEISKPFRTRFGYHIVKVEDKRPARGEVEVAHIMVREKFNPNINEEINKIKRKNAGKKNEKEKQVEENKNENDPKTRIFDIYNKLKEGKDSFENLAKKYSDDKNTAKFGGKLRRFGIRQMVPEFEEQSFALQKIGDFSKPFKTKYGWHIVKLIKKYPVPEFDKAKIELKNKILRDERAQVGKEKLIQQLKQQFKIEMKSSLDKALSYIDKSFFENKWNLPKGNINEEILFEIDQNEKVTFKDFFEFIYKRQKQNPNAYKNKKEIIEALFEQFKKEKLFAYYMNHLEEIYPDFANTINEYKNGLMLFYIKSDMIWTKAAKDTVGQKEFFEQNKNNYKINKRYKILMIQANDKKTASKISKFLKKGKSINYIKKKYNNVIINEKILNRDDAFVQKHQLEENKTLVYKDNNQYLVLKLMEILPEQEAVFKNVVGKVISDYQNYLEEQWLKELKQKYPVKINESVWKKIRSKYKN